MAPVITDLPAAELLGRVLAVLSKADAVAAGYRVLSAGLQRTADDAAAAARGAAEVASLMESLKAAPLAELVEKLKAEVAKSSPTPAGPFGPFRSRKA